MQVSADDRRQPRSSASGAHSPASVATPVTRGLRAIAHTAHWAGRNAHARPIPAPIKRPGRWWMPSLSCAVVTLRGAPRNGFQVSRNVIRAGRYLHAPRLVLSYAEMAWCPRHDTADTLAIRGRPPTRAWSPTTSEAPISKGTSTWATGATVIRAPWPMVTSAVCPAAGRSHRPVCKKRSPCSPACSKSWVSPSVSVLTTGSPVRRRPSPVCHRCQRGGCAGIRPVFIAPGKPQQDGHHARMHRRLTTEPTRPPAATRRAPQYTFDRCRPAFNC
jgi:hypothetical protein